MKEILNSGPNTKITKLTKHLFIIVKFSSNLLKLQWNLNIKKAQVTGKICLL